MADRDQPRELNGKFWAFNRSKREASANPPQGDRSSLQSNDESRDEANPNSVRPEIMIDDSSLLPFHFLRVGDRIGRAVVKLQREDGSTGTGFLVAPDILLTNHHVLPDEITAATTIALANYEANPPDDPAGRPAVVPLDPHSMFVTNPDLDFTFCGVRGLDFLGSVQLDRKQMHVSDDETVNIIQHPRGRPKEVVLRDNWVVRADSVMLHYSCDTEPGSSGSPVFNNRWNPVALHHASVLTDSPEGRSVAGDDSGRYINEGIRLSAIALWLETTEASAAGRGDQVTRLRALFGGLNANIGFFGALGRHSKGRSAPEVVADSYLGETDNLDIGYWNTRPMGGIPGKIVPDFARVLADMGLDLWCLTQATRPEIESLCNYLRIAYRVDFDSVFVRPEDEASPVFLYRRLTDLQVERLDVDAESEALRIAAGAEEAAPSAVRTPGAVRVVAGRKRGGMVEMRLAVLTRASEVAPLVPAVCETPSIFDWVLLGDTCVMFAPDTLRAFAGTGRPLLAAAGELEEGATAWLPGPNSNIEKLFVSPNLRPVFGAADDVLVAHDRVLPISLLALDGPRPAALRLTLEDKPEETPQPPDNIESRLRSLFEPIFSRFLSELRGDR